MTGPATPAYRPPLWIINAPIALWWAGLIGLVVWGSTLAIAWFLSGLLMLLNATLQEEAEAVDSAGNAPRLMVDYVEPEPDESPW